MLVFLLSCGENDTTVSQLSGGYVFNDRGIGRREIYPTIMSDGDMVYADVVDHVYDSNFILIEQKPSFEWYKYSLGFNLYFRFESFSEYLRQPDIVNSSSWSRLKGKIEADTNNYKLFHAYGATEANSHQDSDIELWIADSLLRNDPYYKRIISAKQNFWIISVATNSLFGPFSNQDYFRKKRELKIPDGLKLNFEK
jgi:hypothetical protein